MDDSSFCSPPISMINCNFSCFSSPPVPAAPVKNDEERKFNLLMKFFSAILELERINEAKESRARKIKILMSMRMLFEAMFEHPDSFIWNTFTRLAAALQLETLRSGIEFFLKENVVKTSKKLVKTFKIARKAQLFLFFPLISA